MFSDILRRYHKTCNTILVDINVTEYRNIHTPICSTYVNNILRNLIPHKITLPREVIVGNRDKNVARIKEILSIETLGRKIIVVTAKNRFDCYTTITEWQEILKEWKFIEIHRGLLVNPRHIQSIRDHVMTMSDGSTRYISRRKYESVIKQVVSKW